jgi:thiamine biosynthesis protein ThiC
METGGESMTQLEMPRSGEITPEMEIVAAQE